MHKPTSIIIINHNNKDLPDVVDKCLQQISKDDEIIIVNDDTNNIDVVDRIKKECPQVISVNAVKKHNRAHNRNIGLTTAKNEVILMIDGDILIDDNALELISISLSNQNIVAVTGFIHLMGYTSEHLDMLGLIPKESYFDIISPQNSISHPEILDYRTHYGDDRLNADKNWFYFFSGFFAIHKGHLPCNVIFLEDLEGWGAEDIEFAYQLSLFGKLYFNRKINNVHIPHERDHVKNLINNHKNLYVLLRQHPMIDFEVLLTFSSPRESIVKVQETIDSISSLVPKMFKNYQKNCLYTTIYSDNYPNIYVYGSDKHRYSLLGMAIPMSTQSVEKAFIDANIVNYPISIFCLILREHLRVANKVYIIGSIDTNSFENKNNYFRTHIVNYIDLINTEDLRMFNFSQEAEGMLVTSSLPLYEVHLDD